MGCIKISTNSIHTLKENAEGTVEESQSDIKEKGLVGKLELGNWLGLEARITVADEGHSHTKHEITNKYTIHATITGITPQLHESHRNYTIHATITRFTPQSQKSQVIDSCPAKSQC